MNSLFRSLPVIALTATFMLQSGISFEQTISRAIQVSNDNHRPLMLLFVSEDCKDCPRLQEYLEGESIKEAVARQYVAARVDINDFDGKACSEIYGIAEVPALVIVDSKGTIMYKAQGSISLEELSGLIEDKADEAAAVIAEAREVEVIEPDMVENDKVIPLEEATPAPISVSDVNNAPSLQEETKAHVEVASVKIETPPPAPTVYPRTASASIEDIRKQISATGKSYSLQLGFFSNRDYAMRMKTKAAEKGIDGVEIFPVRRDGKDFFRVLFGNYPSAHDADVSSASLKQSGFEVKVHRNRL